MMQKIHVRHLPVLHGGKLVGVLSDRELAAIETLPGSNQLTVEDAMVPDVFVTSADAPLATVAADMARLRLGSAIVLEGRPRGRRVHRRGRPAGARRRAHAAAGSASVKQVRPGRDSTRIVPPWSATMRWTIARPRPVPCYLVVKKASNTGSSSPNPGRRPRRRSRPRRPRRAPRGGAGRPCSAIASIALRVRLSST